MGLKDLENLKIFLLEKILYLDQDSLIMTIKNSMHTLNVLMVNSKF